MFVKSSKVTMHAAHGLVCTKILEIGKLAKNYNIVRFTAPAAYGKRVAM